MNKLLATQVLLALAVCLLPRVSRAEKKETKPVAESGFSSLFNGKTLDGWHIMNQGQFSVKGDVIVLNKGSGWLRSAKQYQDFELRMDFRFLHKAANSGIFFRASKEGANYPSKNYQVQTMDHSSIGSIYSGGLPGPKEKKDLNLLKKTLKQPGQWQSYEIKVEGKRVEVKINGQVITVADGLAERPGYIGIQGEGGQLEFKNIRVKELTGKNKSK